MGDAASDHSLDTPVPTKDWSCDGHVTVHNLLAHMFISNVSVRLLSQAPYLKEHNTVAPHITGRGV